MQGDGQRYIAIINTVEDEQAKLSTNYDLAQLQFFNLVVRFRVKMYRSSCERTICVTVALQQV
jgi:hypothetical protein